MKILITSLFTILSFLAGAQETKKLVRRKDNVTERYYVLKSDKEIKHGQYLRYSYDILDNKVIHEFGEFNLNEKSNLWMTFHMEPTNTVKSIGEYRNNKKYGDWVTFHRPMDTSMPIKVMLGYYKRSNIIKPKKNKDEVSIEIDTSDLGICSNGRYKDNSKIGVWKYYSPYGKLIHVYDHSNNMLLENYDTSEKNMSLKYLGGDFRFYREFLTAILENDLYYYGFYPEEAKYEVIKEDGKTTYICLDSEANGSNTNPYKAVFDLIPDDWILPNERLITEAKSFTIFAKDYRQGFAFRLEFK